MATPYDMNQGVPTIGIGSVPPTGGGAPGQDWSWLAPFLTGVGSLATSGLSLNSGQQAAGMADPFSGERGAYMGALRNYMGNNAINPSQVMAGSNNALGMLGGLLSNPQSLTTMPGYQFGLNQALEGVNRGAGASGMLDSGNRLAALQDRGQQYAQGWQQQMFNELLGNVQANNSVAGLGLQAQGQGEAQLAQLAGANTGNPAMAGMLFNQARQQQANSIGAGIGGIAGAIPGGISALQRFMNGGSPTGGMDMNPMQPIQGGGMDMNPFNPVMSSTDTLGTNQDIFSTIFGDNPFG